MKAMKVSMHLGLAILCATAAALSDREISDLIEKAFQPPRSKSPPTLKAADVITNISAVSKILREIEMKPGSTFMEVGSGSGSGVLAAAMLMPNMHTIGVEADTPKHVSACSALNQLKYSTLMPLSVKAKVEFRRSTGFSGVGISSADVISGIELEASRTTELARALHDEMRGGAVYFGVHQLPMKAIDGWMLNGTSSFYEFGAGRLKVYFYKRLNAEELETRQQKQEEDKVRRLREQQEARHQKEMAERREKEAAEERKRQQERQRQEDEQRWKRQEQEDKKKDQQKKEEDRKKEQEQQEQKRKEEEQKRKEEEQQRKEEEQAVAQLRRQEQEQHRKHQDVETSLKLSAPQLGSSKFTDVEDKQSQSTPKDSEDRSPDKETFSPVDKEAEQASKLVHDVVYNSGKLDLNFLKPRPTATPSATPSAAETSSSSKLPTTKKASELWNKYQTKLSSAAALLEMEESMYASNATGTTLDDAMEGLKNAAQAAVYGDHCTEVFY